MPIERYQNFDIRIRRQPPGTRKRYIVEADGIEETFKYPFTKDREVNIGLEARGGASSSRRATDPARYIAAREIGQDLFNCALPGKLLEAWSVLRARAEKQGSGLRLRLRCPGAPEVMDLPWEYAWYAQGNFHLAMYESTPLVRCIDVRGDVRKAVRIERPLRILVVHSSPRGLPRLKGSNEWTRMAGKFAAGGNVELTLVSRPASLERLIDELGKREYHALHFIGHGRFNRNTNKGELVFEDAKSLPEPVDSTRLGQIIRNHPSLRLAVLNSCEGARASDKDLFGGVAQQLLQQGLPATIGMQYEIPDTAALRFSESFYQKIAEGRPPEAALSYARLQMATTDGMEWAIPVLYTHPDAVRLFILPDPVPKCAPTPPPDPPESVGEIDEAYYVHRAAEERLGRLFRATGVSLVISGPGQFGRTTALRQLAEQAVKLNKRAVWLDISNFAAKSFMSSNDFFLEFTLEIAQQLDKRSAWPQIIRRWSTQENNIGRCRECVEDLLTGIPDNPAISIFLDGVDCLLEAPFRDDFSKLLRVWHGERRVGSPWFRVDLVVATSEESWSLELSKFEEISLLAFTEDETARLNRKRKPRLTETQLRSLWTLLGGHPELVQRCLRSVADGVTPATDVTLTDRDPLASQLAFIEDQVNRRDLLKAIKQVLAGETCTDNRAFYQLRSLGIIGRYRRPVKFTCPLYREFFRELTAPEHG